MTAFFGLVPRARFARTSRFALWRVLSVNRLLLPESEGCEHHRIGVDVFGFQPFGLNAGAGGNQQSGNFALAAVIPRRRVGPAVDGPTQRRRIVFLIFEVDIRTLDQSRHETVFAK